MRVYFLLASLEEDLIDWSTLVFSFFIPSSQKNSV